MKHFLKFLSKHIFRRKQQATFLACAVCFIVILTNLQMLHRVTISRTKQIINLGQIGIENSAIPVLEYRRPLAEHTNMDNTTIMKNDISMIHVEKDYEFSLRFTTSRIPQEKFKLVIIVAGFRTGSTFVGEFFNQHPDVFYVFEPLYYTNREKPCDKSLSASSVLQDITLCNMTTMRNTNTKALHKLSQTSDTKEQRHSRVKSMNGLKKCIYKGICFRHKSKRLCSKESCDFDASMMQCRSCPPVDVDFVERVCHSSKVRVIKVIRLCHLKTLKSLWEHPRIDMKIIHLVRDPRSTALSRSLVKHATNTIETTCKNYLSNHIYYLTRKQNAKNSWLEGIYKVLRYEDVIEDPLNTVKELYSFINSSLGIHKDVTDWLQKGTTISDGFPFGSMRNTEEQKYKWRKNIAMEMVNDVQKVCSEMMALFGYRIVKSEEELRDIKKSLLSELD